MGVTVAGKTTIDAGTGNDRVLGDQLDLTGNANVNLGAGDDVIDIGTVVMAVGATIKFDAGLGIDRFDNATVFSVGVASFLGFDADPLDILDDVDDLSIQAAIITAIEACLDLELAI